ncbi:MULTISPECIES: DUF742 domain-containing protein [unclassified Streptomyces]|uniref:DUF742 domain-containing protein n=1 Tax=unclassified Streptomyces TaxID=2593676 RepID=UPI002E771056|nr:DUF742 domain-containing protein [Streptomyces sp. JV176]MEE1797227.1 DUF742 domain-containing protein [Streptomyces sp. JV176]
MATPPGGHPYDGGPRSPGEYAQNRFNFPSTPSGQGGGQGEPSHDQGGQGHGGQGGGRGGPQRQPYQPPPPPPPRPYEYDQPRQPRIQPVQPRRSPEAEPSMGTHNPLVRPYAMTGGRTRPRYQLAIEALVSTTADPSQLQGQLPEHQRICQLCFEIKSVAEVSALLSIPLGVARILVADLAEAGLVAIHQPGGDEATGGQPDVTLLERVLSGLRKL